MLVLSSNPLALPSQLCLQLLQVALLVLDLLVLVLYLLLNLVNADHFLTQASILFNDVVLEVCKLLYRILLLELQEQAWIAQELDLLAASTDILGFPVDVAIVLIHLVLELTVARGSILLGQRRPVSLTILRIVAMIVTVLVTTLFTVFVVGCVVCVYALLLRLTIVFRLFVAVLHPNLGLVVVLAEPTRVVMVVLTNDLEA